MSEISSSSNDKGDSTGEGPDLSSSSGPSASATSSRKADTGARRCFRPVAVPGGTCGTPYTLLGPGRCPFKSQAPECPFAQEEPTAEDELLPQWLPGGHIAEQFQERERTIHLDIEFKMFGSSAHLEKHIRTLDRLLELHGYRDAWINVRPD